MLDERQLTEKIERDGIPAALADVEHAVERVIGSRCFIGFARPVGLPGELPPLPELQREARSLATAIARVVRWSADAGRWRAGGQAGAEWIGDVHHAWMLATSRVSVHVWRFC